MTGSNVGNMAFKYGIQQVTGADTMLPWDASGADLTASGAVGVICCANQLGPHTDLGGLVTNYSDAETRFVVLGLGAQWPISNKDIPPVPEGTRKWLSVIASQSVEGEPNIGVRGPFTLKVLDRIGLGLKSSVLGCPSLFINPNPDLGTVIENQTARSIERIAVAAGDPVWGHLKRLENSLTRLATATGGAYIIQGSQEMVKLGRGEFDLLPFETQKACRDFTCPELTLHEFRDWARRHARVFFNIPAWIEYLRGFDFVIGARIHGIVLAMQAGVPGLCIAHDSRTKELCEVMKIPYVTADKVQQGIERDDIAHLFEFSGKAFDLNRAMLAQRLDEFLAVNGVDPTPVLARIRRQNQSL